MNRTIKEALDDGSLSLEDEIYYADMTEEEYKQEIERLNNIINELEKTLLEWHEYWEDDDSYSWQYKNIYDYLQELKGSDSNVKD